MSYGYVHRRPPAELPPQGPILGFAPATYSAEDDAGVVELTVARTGSSAGACAVNYISVDGTALAGLDYVSVSGTLSWLDGDATPQPIPVSLLASGEVFWDPDLLSGEIPLSPDRRTLTVDEDGGGCRTLSLEPASGREYIEIHYSGGSTVTATYCFVGFVQVSSFTYAELHAQFGAEPGPNQSSLWSSAHGVSNLAVAVPVAGVVGFLIDWEAQDLRMSLDGLFINPQTGVMVADPDEVPGLPITYATLELTSGFGGV